MKSLAKVVVGIVTSVLLFSSSVCWAQFSDLEQKALHEEAAKIARNTGLSENDMYRNLSLMYRAKQFARVAQNTADPMEAKHADLRAHVYEFAADASLKIAFTLKVAKELIADLEKEQATGAKIVSPALSRRINGVGTAATDALLMAAKMTSAMVELASFEAAQGCNTKQKAYTVTCSEELQKSIAEIQAAMDILKKAVAPFANAAVLRGIKQFTY